MEFFQDNLSVSQRTSYLEQACGLLCEGTRTLLAFLSRGGWGGGELRNVVLDSPEYNVLPTPHAHDRVPLQIFAPSVQTVRERGNRCLRVVPLPFLRVVGRKRKGRGFKPPWLSHAAWAGCFACFNSFIARPNFIRHPIYLQLTIASLSSSPHIFCLENKPISRPWPQLQSLVSPTKRNETRHRNKHHQNGARWGNLAHTPCGDRLLEISP